jgi:hypothetical protein
MTYANTTPSAQALTADLGGTWRASYGSAPCPVCQPERRRDQRGLSLRQGQDGRLLAHCHKTGCAFADVLAALGHGPGTAAPPDPLTATLRAAEAKAEAENRSRQARALWDAAQPIEGTPAETYLRERAITAPLPDVLRFHPEAWHGPTAKRSPAMIARVDGAERFAVHRTYLTPEGAKMPGEGAKMMLGATAGGAVRLGGAGRRLAMAEGIETALSLASGLLRGPATVWAALSASGVAGLRLPDRPGELMVAPDGDEAGRRAAYDLAARASSLGWTVSLLPAPEGRDWNDVLAAKGGAA